MRAALLVQAVVQPARDQVPVAARQPERQQRAVGDVEDGLLDRDLRGQGRARPLVRTAAWGTTASASRPVGGSKRDG